MNEGLIIFDACGGRLGPTSNLRTSQKVVRLPPAEFCYYPSASSAGSAADAPNFVLVEVLLPQPKPTAEKEAFWAEFQAGVSARLCSMEVDVFLRFIEMPGENVYFNRKEPPL